MELLMIIIIALLLSFVFWVRQSNDYEIRRIQENQRRQQKYEREQRELEEKCKGKTPEEQFALQEQYLEKLEAESRETKRKILELEREERKKKLAEQMRYQSSSMTGTIWIAGGSAFPSMKWESNEASTNSSRRRRRSHGCGCDCDDCLEGRHEDCEDDCDHW